MYTKYKSATNDSARLQKLIDDITAIGIATYRDDLGYTIVTDDDGDKVVSKRFGVDDLSASKLHSYAQIQTEESTGDLYVPHIETMRSSTRMYGGYKDEYVDLINSTVDLTDIIEE